MDSDEEIPTLIAHETQPDLTKDKRVPLTIICGFLGAGKSTLLRRILTEKHGYRIAVIMNEFGDTADIEAKTINVSSAEDPTAENSEEFLELANGCLCCSIKDLGIAAIEKLMLKKGAFDHILLETTGLADPAPIATMLWHNEELAAGLGNDIVLDGVICMVDAVFGRQQLAEDSASDDNEMGESLRQITGSDVILLNKIDAASTEDIEALESSIHTINSVAPIHRTSRAEIDLKHIIGIHAFTSGPQSQSNVTSTHVQDESAAEHEHDHDHPKTHYELKGISSLQIDCPALTQSQLDALDVWIRSVLWDKTLPPSSATHEPASAATGSNPQLEILRCKGSFSDVSGAQYVLQGVRSMYDIAKMGKGETKEEMGVPEAGKIVLIGKGLTDVVRASLLAVVQ